VKGQGPAILGGFQQADPKRSEYLEMMRFFEDAGARDKDSMITIVTWLLAFAAVIIGFVATQQVHYRPFCTKDPVATAIFSGIGILVCGLASKLVLEFAEHARSNFIKADYSSSRVHDLDRIFCGEMTLMDLSHAEVRTGEMTLMDLSHGEVKTGEMTVMDLSHAKVRTKVGYRVVLKRVGRIFRNFLVFAALLGLALFGLFCFGIGTAFDLVPKCRSGDAAAVPSMFVIEHGPGERPHPDHA
jgi:hypothetical protein